jgi:hypothetical protein
VGVNGSFIVGIDPETNVGTTAVAAFYRQTVDDKCCIKLFVIGAELISVGNGLEMGNILPVTVFGGNLYPAVFLPAVVGKVAVNVDDFFIEINGRVGIDGNAAALNDCIAAASGVLFDSVVTVIAALSGCMRNYKADFGLCVLECLEGEFEYDSIVSGDSVFRGELVGQCVNIDNTVVKGLNLGAFFVFVAVVISYVGKVFPTVGKKLDTFNCVFVFLVKVVGKNECFVVVEKLERNNVETVRSCDVLNGNGNGDIFARYVVFGSIDH